MLRSLDDSDRHASWAIIICPESFHAETLKIGSSPQTHRKMHVRFMCRTMAGHTKEARAGPNDALFPFASMAFEIRMFSRSGNQHSFCNSQPGSVHLSLAPTRIMKWEYATVVVETSGWFITGKIDGKTFNDKLNEFGEQGWELVSVYDTNFANGGTGDVIAVFKRPMA